MSRDLKVYTASKLNLDDKDVKYNFIDYFQIHHDDILSVEDMHRYYDDTYDSNSWDENRAFPSDVFIRERFESDDIVKPSEIKSDIMNHEKYKNNEFQFVVIQEF